MIVRASGSAGPTVGTIPLRRVTAPPCRPSDEEARVGTVKLVGRQPLLGMDDQVGIGAALDGKAREVAVGGAAGDFSFDREGGAVAAAAEPGA